MNDVEEDIKNRRNKNEEKDWNNKLNKILKRTGGCCWNFNSLSNNLGRRK